MTEEDSISPADLLRQALRDWWLLALIIILSLSAATVSLSLVPAKYSASMVVGPTARIGMAGRGVRQVPDNGPARSIAETADGEVLSDFSRFLHLLTTPDLARALTADDNLMRVIFADEWDEADGGWRPSPNMGARLQRFALAVIGRTPWEPPDAHRLAQRLRSALSIKRVAETPMRRLVYRHHDREFAEALLTRLHATAEGALRSEAQRRTEAEIAFLEAQLAGVTRQDRRAALVELLSDEQTMAMMIALDLPVAADIIEAPNSAAIPDWPNPLVVYAAALLIGMLIAAMILFARASPPSQPAQDQEPKTAVEPIPLRAVPEAASDRQGGAL